MINVIIIESLSKVNEKSTLKFSIFKNVNNFKCNPSDGMAACLKSLKTPKAITKEAKTVNVPSQPTIDFGKFLPNIPFIRNPTNGSPNIKAILFINLLNYLRNSHRFFACCDKPLPKLPILQQLLLQQLP